MLDLRRLDRVEVVPEDGYVLAEAGCTWEALDAALEPLGSRTPFRGPLSGRRATVGGTLSQNAIFFGSGLHGTASDSVLGLEVVLASGALLRTGSSAASGTPPFLRAYGPDLTGLFLGDSGALGIKARASLRLLPRPAARTPLSIGFRNRASCLEALLACARLGRASELAADQALLAGSPWSLHAVVEGESRISLLSRALAGSSPSRKRQAAPPSTRSLAES